MEKPLVSVVMPVYNAEKFLDQAIQSILDQTYTNFELIIVDDASTDGSPQIIADLASNDPRIIHITNETNRGIAYSRNIGMDLAKGKYLAPMDNDDVSNPDRLKTEIDFMESNPEYAVVGSNIKIINSSGEKLGVRKYPQTYEKIIDSVLLESPFAHPSTLIRVSSVRKFGGHKYNECGDYDLWFKILNEYKGANLDAFLLDYRLTNSQAKSKKLKHILKNTIEIQSHWLFNKKFFRVKNLFFHLGLRVLYLFPAPIIMKLFIMFKIK